MSAVAHEDVHVLCMCAPSEILPGIYMYDVPYLRTHWIILIGDFAHRCTRWTENHQMIAVTLSLHFVVRVNLIQVSCQGLIWGKPELMLVCKALLQYLGRIL